MPWKECSAMDERLQFVARRLAGEAMSELCREFGISRKTGYKIFERYQECGVQWLTDRSRRPHHSAHKAPFPGGDLHPDREAGAPPRGGAKVSGAPDPRFPGNKDPGQEPHPCAAGPPRFCRAPGPFTSPREGHGALLGPAPQ